MNVFMIVRLCQDLNHGTSTIFNSYLNWLKLVCLASDSGNYLSLYRLSDSDAAGHKLSDNIVKVDGSSLSNLEKFDFSIKKIPMEIGC